MRAIRGALAAGLIVAAGAAPAGAANTIGAPGAGDPFFPFAGNGGLNVRDYSLALAYDPAARRLEGTATLQITATQDLTRFDLDLRGFQLGTVTVAGTPAAAVARDGQELVITPAQRIRRGTAFTVVVPYTGTPQTVIDPDGSSEGWVYTADGAVVVNEPQGSPGWYPANDTPRDKATYTVSMTVPDGLEAVGNGSLESRASSGGRTTFVWREGKAMAPYLTTVTIGRFDISEGAVGAIPTYVAVDPKLGSSASSTLRKLPDMVAFLAATYGAYPFETVGAIVDDAPELGYSLETQTKPVFDRSPDELTLLHELSHMWFGDAVTLSVWPDIWLHEGFATWSEWYWTERQGGKSAAQRFKQLAGTPAKQTSFWNPPPGDPGDPADLFDGTIYDRGGMTLEALRERIGDPSFFRLMRTWYADHKYGNVTTPQFVALAEQISGQDLGAFFDGWLYQPGKPAGLADGAAATGASARR